MDERPYYCPNCRSNRVKFSVISRMSQSFDKDAVTGSVMQSDDPQMLESAEPDIACRVCGFVGNEQRFIRQAERDPRYPADVPNSPS